MMDMDSTTQALIVGAVAALVILVSRMVFGARQRLNLPPGPRALPIIGCLHLLGNQPYKDLANLARKHGPVMWVPLGQKGCVIATSPDAAKEFLQRQDANFCSRPRMRSADIVTPNDIIFHDITPVTRHLRKILVTELTSTKQVDASKHIRAEEMALMVRAIAREAGRPVRVCRYAGIMASNILTRVTFNKRLRGVEAEPESASDVMHAFVEIIEEQALVLGAIQLQDVFDFVPEWFDPQGWGARARRIKEFTHAFHGKMISQHQEDRKKNPILEKDKNLVDVLLEQLDNSEYKITMDSIEGVIEDIFGAGIDTTTVTVEWAMAEVLRNPTMVKKARMELDHVVGLNRLVQESDILELKYIQAIVKESLRLHASLPMLIPHQNTHATKVFGYDIPAKTRVFVNIWAIGRDPAIWEDPLDFKPERFLEGGAHATTEMQGQCFELIPFGAGRRQCPGMVFGSIAVHLQVANLLHAFDWSFLEGVTADTLDMSDGLGLTPPMKTSLVIVAKPRLPSNLYEVKGHH